jgi:Peptidase MA superfamily
MKRMTDAARTRLRRSRARFALALVAGLVVACGNNPASVPPAPSAVPTPAPTVNLTRPPGSLSPSAEIEFLVESLAANVRIGNKADYLALVDLSDPGFRLEHSRLADEWSGLHPVPDYALAVDDVEVDGDVATGSLTATWTNFEGEARTATWLGSFGHSDGNWRYTGEVWQTTEVPHFTVKVAPGLDDEVARVTEDLAAVYDHVTDALDYVPAAALQIKLYADAPALAANTLLSLPDIRGWNEPGEALKLRVDPEDPYMTPVIAHEMTHFASFDRAGTKRTKMPWWLDEGLASYVARKFDTIQSNSDPALETVAAWQADGTLVDWDRMAVYETTPQELWRNVYPQGYAMVRFVTQRFGRDPRNAWLAKMATEMDIDAATPAVLGMSFDDLDKAFREWLTQVH